MAVARAFIVATVFVQRCVASCGIIAMGGCVHFNQYATFTKTSPASATASVDVNVNDFADFKVVSVLLCLSKSTNAPPYSLRIYAADASHRCTALRIDECEVRYSDGSIARLLNESLEIPFAAFGEENVARHNLGKAIDRLQGFELRIRGARVFDEGTEVPFIENYKFDHQTVKGVMP